MVNFICFNFASYAPPSLGEVIREIKHDVYFFPANGKNLTFAVYCCLFYVKVSSFVFHEHANYFPFSSDFFF